MTIPAFDINDLPATSWTLTGGSPTANVKIGTISGGVFTTAGAPAGCTISVANTFQPVAGTTNGQIEVGGCTGFSPGKTLAIEFQATSPGQQANTYVFPATIDGLTTSPTWIGDNEVQESFSIGLTVVVNPVIPDRADDAGGGLPDLRLLRLADRLRRGCQRQLGHRHRRGARYGHLQRRHDRHELDATVNVSGANPACTGSCSASGSAIRSNC